MHFFLGALRVNRVYLYISAVRFIYNCTVESIDRLKKEEGSGAIVAHCMGLGKTLSVSRGFSFNSLLFITSS